MALEEVEDGGRERRICRKISVSADVALFDEGEDRKGEEWRGARFDIEKEFG
jgi:hypothetical protein